MVTIYVIFGALLVLVLCIAYMVTSPSKIKEALKHDLPDFMHTPPPPNSPAMEAALKLRSCYDCSFLVAKVNWWCSNKDAIKARGTAIPGCIHCPYWKPEMSMIK